MGAWRVTVTGRVGPPLMSIVKAFAVASVFW